MKRIRAPILAGLLLFILILPQSVLAAGPAISNVVVDTNSITATSATIYWITNTSSDSRVNYGTTEPKDGTWDDVHISHNVTTHIVDLTGLTAATTYYFEVQSTDGSGTATDNNDGEYYEFTTGPPQYSITLDHDCSVCGDLWEAGDCGEVIKVTAFVAVAGTYHICWDSRTSASVVDGGTFTKSEPGKYELSFPVPETAGGIHTVYLTNTAFNDLGEDAEAPFTVNPAVKLSSDSPLESDNEGPVGTEVTLNGIGFNSNEQIRIEFNDTVVSSSTAPTANSNGSWEFSYTIPDTPGGRHSFDVGPRSNPDVVWVSKDFKVIPEITAPESGTVGQTIVVKGTGFQSEESQIEITFTSESTSVKVVVMEGITANEAGTWTEEIVVPTLQRGTYFIDASGESTRARDITDIEVTLVPGIFFDKASAPVGDPIGVRGGGFTANEPGIMIRFDEQVVASGITADEDGTWAASFDVPVSVFGSHTISASGDRTPAVENSLDTEALIVEFSPDEGAPGDLVSVRGNGFHGGQDLTVTIGGVEALDSLQTQSNGNFNISFHVPKGSPLGEQSLTVTDEGGATGSVDFAVTEKTLSTTPLPVSPKDSTLRSGKVTFRWGTGGDTGYTYNLEISQTAAFSTNFRSKSGIVESTYTLTDTETLTETLPPGTYYWRVKIVDDYGNEGEWSDPIEFRVSPIPVWVWVVIGLVVLVVLMVVAYRETKFRVSE